jgi:hypothetical protein
MSFTLTQSCAIAKSTAKIARSSKSVSRRRGQQLVVKAEETSTSGTYFSRFCFFSIVSTQIWSVYDRFTSARKEISLGKILLRQTWVSFVSRVWSVFWIRFVGEKKRNKGGIQITHARIFSLSLYLYLSLKYLDNRCDIRRERPNVRARRVEVGRPGVG